MNIFFRKQQPRPAALPAPEHFPAEFMQTWHEIVRSFPHGHLTPQCATQVEMATLLLQDLRASGPDWPAERYIALDRVMSSLSRGV